MAASSRERDESITQPSTLLPLSSEELQNVEWFLKARKMSMRENVTKCLTSVLLKCRLTLLQKVKKEEELDFNDSCVITCQSNMLKKHVLLQTEKWDGQY